MQTKAKCNDSLKCFLSKAFTITQVIIVLTWWGVQTANHTPEWGNRITSQQVIGLQLSHGNNEKFRLFLVPQITVTEVTLWLEMHSSGLEVERMGKWAKGMLHIDALKFFGTFIKQQKPQWSVYLSRVCLILFIRFEKFVPNKGKAFRTVMHFNKSVTKHYHHSFPISMQRKSNEIILNWKPVWYKLLYFCW